MGYVADQSRGRAAGSSLSLVALLLPGVLFGLGLFLVRDQPRYGWLFSLSEYPGEFWVILVAGGIATMAGILDWRYHRSGKTAIGRPEHRSELAALAGGGLPLFVLMAIASVLSRPQVLLVPVLIAVLLTTVMICYDEFVFHRKRCGAYETLLHRLLVFGQGTAWLAWVHWCFVKGGAHA
jgi:hypothetical protein